LERLSGQRPVFGTRTLFPNDGPPYHVVERIRWACPPEKLDEAMTIVSSSFRAAPPDKLSQALYRLREFTARPRGSGEAVDVEASITLWIEKLLCWPGDIVLDVLRRAESRKWWPTWGELEPELQRAVDRRMALLNYVRGLLTTPPPALPCEAPPPTAEERARAVDAWERESAGRPRISRGGIPTRAEPAEEALARACGISAEEAKERLAALPGSRLRRGP
jgi:hypothetical protein